LRVLSVNVGLPQEIVWKGKTVQTGIFKDPKPGRVGCTRLNLDGDRQADLTVHGGTNKAVYGYPHEHYAFWRDKLPQEPLPYGAFGENLTLEGLTEENVHIGDRFRIGTVELVVTQPRQPCFKLAAKFGGNQIVHEMLESGYSGFYFAVLRTGNIGADDTVELIETEPQAVRIADMNRIVLGDADALLMKRAIQIDALPPEWREALQRRIELDDS
jgi:MOSC domain-containing protein YiiM